MQPKRNKAFSATAEASRLTPSIENARQLLAEHFQERDLIWELQEHELTTYLYYLQVASLALD
ncbi:hypothetical protein [Halomicronema sp. CCY15110]|uniref:hypothetical protein n=1 Tax=Halomicronema sp. CCY15110 TaxID=2767773 RepID=UPI00194E829B|nr:hypothetical protein [Halomicronema sp. CCY15110]